MKVDIEQLNKDIDAKRGRQRKFLFRKLLVFREQRIALDIFNGMPTPLITRKEL